jgi:hypothetical protein
MKAVGTRGDEMAVGALDGGARDHRHSGGRSAKAAGTINVIAGIWLIISPFVLRFWHIETAGWNNIIVGIVVLILAAIRVSDPARRMALSWDNLILGIWLFTSPCVLRYNNHSTPMSNDVVLGIVVFGSAAWSLAASPRLHHHGPVYTP